MPFFDFLFFFFFFLFGYFLFVGFCRFFTFIRSFFYLPVFCLFVFLLFVFIVFVVFCFSFCSFCFCIVFVRFYCFRIICCFIWFPFSISFVFSLFICVLCTFCLFLMLCFFSFVFAYALFLSCYHVLFYLRLTWKTKTFTSYKSAIIRHRWNRNRNNNTIVLFNTYICVKFIWRIVINLYFENSSLIGCVELLGTFVFSQLTQCIVCCVLSVFNATLGSLVTKRSHQRVKSDTPSRRHAL